MVYDNLFSQRHLHLSPPPISPDLSEKPQPFKQSSRSAGIYKLVFNFCSSPNCYL